MSVKFSTAVRNARAAATEAAIGTSPTMELRTGAPPANCAAADTGAVVATIALPSDFLTAPSGGVVALQGSWSDSAADSTGTPGHYRIKQGATCHMQGTVTATGGGGDLTLDDITVDAGQTVTITSFQITEGNA